MDYDTEIEIFMETMKNHMEENQLGMDLEDVFNAAACYSAMAEAVEKFRQSLKI